MSLPVLSSVHAHSFPTYSASCTADFADVLSFLSAALLNEIWRVLRPAEEELTFIDKIISFPMGIAGPLL